MRKWVKVGSLGIVDIGDLPKTHTVGSVTYTGLRKLPEATLRAWGFYSYEDAPPAYNKATHYLGSSLVFDGGAVTKGYVAIAKDIDTLRKEKKEEVAAARWEEMSTPATVKGYAALWYADKESVNDMLRESENLRRAIELGHVVSDAVIGWKTADGTFVDMTLSDLLIVQLLLSQKRQSLYAKEAGLIAIVDDPTTTPEEITRVSWKEEV